MAHGEDLLRAATDGETLKKLRLYDNEYDPHLMPKSLVHVVSAVIVDKALGTSWTDVDGHYQTDRHVSCRIFNLSAAIEPPPEELISMSVGEAEQLHRKTYKMAYDAVADLRKMGVGAFLKVHRGFAEGNKGRFINQVLICLPLMRLEGEPISTNYRRDIESAEVFLAYVLGKNWMNAEEIPQETVRDGRSVCYGAFPPEMLKRISGEKVQKRLALLSDSPTDLPPKG